MARAAARPIAKAGRVSEWLKVLVLLVMPALGAMTRRMAGAPRKRGIDQFCQQSKIFTYGRSIATFYGGD